MARYKPAPKNQSASSRSNWKRLGWRVAFAAILVAGGYGAWLLIPFIASADIEPQIKAPIIALLGATPLLTKFAALLLFGKPAIDLMKHYAAKWLNDKA